MDAFFSECSRTVKELNAIELCLMPKIFKRIPIFKNLSRVLNMCEHIDYINFALFIFPIKYFNSNTLDKYFGQNQPKNLASKKVEIFAQLEKLALDIILLIFVKEAC